MGRKTALENFSIVILMKLHIFGQIVSKVNKVLFFCCRKLQVLISSKRKVKVLFSRERDWEHGIRMGFQFTKHEIAFGEFSFDNIKDHDLVVPLTIDDLMYLDGARDLIVDNPVPIPAKEVVLLCNDKYLFAQHLITSGFGDFVPKMGPGLAYPYILKKRVDEGSKNCHIILGPQEEEKFANILTDPEYYTQMIITGPLEYATHILFKDQEILCALNIEYVFENDIPIKRIDKPVYLRICRSPFNDVFSTMLKSIDFEGICCINYKVYNKLPYVLEINPRCCGSLYPYLFSFIERAI